MNRTCRYSTFIFQSARFDWEDLWVKLWPWTLVRAFSGSTNQKNPFMLCLFMMRLLLLHISVTVMKAVRGFFFFIPQALSLQQRGAPLLSTLRYIALSNQTVSDAPQRWPPPQKNPVFVFVPCLPHWRMIGAGCWQEAVSGCAAWSGVCAGGEVNYTAFKTFLYLTIHDAASHVRSAR